MQWNYLSQKKPTTIDELTSLLLANRDIADIDSFLHSKSPLDLTYEEVGLQEFELDKLIERLLIAKETKEQIVVYGDYDCDGVCGTTILWETLFELGLNAAPFIPHREQHGYGLSVAGMEAMLAQYNPSIVISVDNGITANAQWQTLRERGVYTVLTDHHAPDKVLPEVDVFLHTTTLCGATVAWMVAREIEKVLGSRFQVLGKEKVQGYSGQGAEEERIANSLPRRQTGEHQVEKSDVEKMIDLCALATIADQVPLKDANRSFAVHGLAQLNKTQRIGLRTLIDAAGLTYGEIDTYAVNFVIAPRINAMGRLSHALDALRALCTRRKDRAQHYIDMLSTVNQERQELTQELITFALSQAKEWEHEHIIIVASEQFHDGVIGLVAGKLTETFYKPTLAISLSGDFGKGSARSIAGVHITDLLRQVADDLLEVGGHPMAAGFKLSIARLDSFKSRLFALAKERIDPGSLVPKVDIDCELPVSLVELKVAQEITTLAPFGAGNPEPVLAIKNLRILDASVMGKESKHLRLSLIPDGGKPDQVFSAVGWGMGKKITELDASKHYDICGQLSVNTWKGKSKLQITLKAICPQVYDLSVE